MMHPSLRLNTHGIVGILGIILMFGIAYALNWNISWWYFIPALVLYSLAILGLTRVKDQSETFRWLLGCHLSLILLAIGLLINFNYLIQMFIHFLSGSNETDIAMIVPFFRLPYFVQAIAFGFMTAFLLFHKDSYDLKLSSHGIFALIFVVLMFAIAFFQRWAINLFYFLAAIDLYMGRIVYLNAIQESSNRYTARGSIIKSDPLKRLLGCHFAFILLLIGFVLHFSSLEISYGFFIGSIAAGLVMPYLLFR